jgi:hypothetical protein
MKAPFAGKAALITDGTGALAGQESPRSPA